MDSSTLLPYAAIATVRTGFVCFHIILKTLPNINKITKPMVQRNSAAKIKYIYLISSLNSSPNYFELIYLLGNGVLYFC